MKKIEIPEQVELKNAAGQSVKDEQGIVQRMTFQQFVQGRLVDPKFGSDMAAVMSAQRIQIGLSQANGELMLDEVDWKRLKEAVESPQGGYHPLIAVSLLPFMRAVTEAQDTPAN